MSYDGKQMADILGQMIDHNTLAVGLRNFIGSFRHRFGVVEYAYLQHGVLELGAFVIWRVSSCGLIRVDFGTCMICSAYTLHEL
jgi:hypothetical protein